MGDTQHESESVKPFIKLRNDAGTDDIHYSLFYEDIPNEFKAVAVKELNETEENRRVGILKLREFLKRQDISEVEDYMLITVLRNCKFNIEKSKKKLMKYLQIYSTVSEWLQKTDWKRIENVLDNRVTGVLPYRDKYGRVIFFTAPYDIDFNLFEMDDVAFCGICLFFYMLSFPLTTIAGVVYIGESKSPSLSVFYAAMKTFRQYVHTFLNLPIRIAKFEFINENFITRWTYNIIKPFLSSKVIERIQFYGSDIQNLQKLYHPAILPEEFGGTMGPLNSKFMKEDFFNFVKRLKSKQ